MRSLRFPSWFLCLLLAPFGVPTATSAGSLFYEAVLITGDAGDYDSSGALDLSDVYLGEVAPYILETDTMRDQIVLRIEPRNLNDITYCGVQLPRAFVLLCEVRYDAFFRANGKDHNLYAVVQPPRNVSAANSAVVLNDTSVKFLLDRAALGLVPGTTIENLYVTTKLVSQGQAQPADRAPGENDNQPYDPTAPGPFAAPYRLRGTYPFFHVESLTPLTLPSADGSAVEFRLRITTSPHVQEDNIYIRWDGNWSIVPSRGATGYFAYGLLTGIRANTTQEFDFTATPRDLVERGDLLPLPTRLHSSSQGHALLPYNVRITGPTYDDPDYVFRLLHASPLRQGKPAVLTFGLTDAEGVPRLGLPIDVHFRHQDRLVATVDAEETPDGYRVQYRFPKAGTWTVEPVIARMNPSPHGLISLHVAAESPAGPILVPLLALPLLALLRRRTEPASHNGF